MPKVSQPRRPRTNLSLRVVRRIPSIKDRNGIPWLHQPDKVDRNKAIVNRAATLHERQKTRREGTYILQSNVLLITDKLIITAMPTEQRQALETLISSSNRQAEEWLDVPFDATLDDVLEGTEPLEISNGGQEFIDLARDITGDWKNW